MKDIDWPGVVIREEMDARGWDVEEFARKINRSTHLCNELLNGQRKITDKIAYALSNAFGTGDPYQWLALERTYRRAIGEEVGQ